MRYLLTFLYLFAFLTLSTFDAHAVSSAGAKNAEFSLNQASPEAMRKYQLGTLVTKDKVWDLKVTYDFSKTGGAIGSQNLRTSTSYSPKLPANAVITGCYIDVLSALTSGGSATLALSTGKAADDLKAALAYGSYTGIVACVPVGTAATAIKLTADVTPTVTIAGAAVTAGKFNVHILYVLSE